MDSVNLMISDKKRVIVGFELIGKVDENQKEKIEEAVISSVGEGRVSSSKNSAEVYQMGSTNFTYKINSNNTSICSKVLFHTENFFVTFEITFI